MEKIVDNGATAKKKSIGSTYKQWEIVSYKAWGSHESEVWGAKQE